MSQIYEGTLAASAARSAAIQVEPSGSLAQPASVKMIEVTVDTTAATTGSVVPAIEVFDEAKGGWVPVLTGVAITAVGTVVLRYGVDCFPVANLTAQGIPPKRWRVNCSSNATAQTFSVSARVYVE